MLILLPLVILCACLSTKVGANPYLCGAATVTVGVTLHLTNNHVLVLVASAYAASYFTYTAHELGGVSADLNTTLASVSSHVTQQAVVFGTFLRILIFVIGFTLPIGKPDAYITGVGAAALAVMLIVLSSHRRGGDLTVMLIQGVLYGCAGWFLSRFTFELDLTPAMIAGMGIARYLFQQYETIEPETRQVFFPGIVKSGFILGLTWLTPGLSFSLVGSALLPASQYRNLWLVGLSAGIEGWALKTILNGSATSKSMLGDLLVDQLGAGRFSASFETSFSVCLGLGLAALCSVGLLKFKSWLEPARELGVFLLLIEGILAVGLWMIPFIFLACIVQVFKLKCQGSDAGTATGFLVPVVIGG